MKKLLLLVALFGCQSKTDTLATAESTVFVASLDDSIIQTAYPHKLTPTDYERLEQAYPKTLDRIEALNPLSVQDIKNMTRAGLDDKTIIHEIQLTRSQFYLTPEDEVELRQAGVSSKVVLNMKHTVDDRY